ncbi:MAG: hypothetical protein GF332_01900 [Candidatus Moranbacteria bacterium]|nr:hypothetical protein [Candidatus Moranbacteria bacterium]
MLASRLFIMIVIILSLLIGLSSVRKKPCLSGELCSLKNQKIQGWAQIQSCKTKPDFTSCYLSDVKVDYVGSQFDDEAKDFKAYKGKALVRINNQAFIDWQYADLVAFTGTIEEPENFADFNYKKFLEKRGVRVIIKKAQMEKLVSGENRLQNLEVGQQLKLFLARAKTYWEQKLFEIWPDKKIAGLVKALLLGDKTWINQDFYRKIQIAGVAHLVAVSGMHIGILILICWELLKIFRINRATKVILTHILLLVFVAMIGMPASALRAWLMSILIFTGKLSGRRIDLNRILLISCLLLLLINPYYLFYDLGFELSFLAVAGLINILPWLEKFYSQLLKKSNPISQKKESQPIRKTNLTILNKLWHWAGKLILASLAVQIAILPLLVKSFGLISVISLITNLLAAWAIFPIIIFTLLSLALVGFSKTLAEIPGFLVEILGSYLIFLINKAASFSWASLEINPKSWVYVLAGSLIVVIVIWPVRLRKFFNFQNNPGREV